MSEQLPTHSSAEKSPCGTCKGKGWLKTVSTYGKRIAGSACPTCQGTGYVTYKPAERQFNSDRAEMSCVSCHGTGKAR